MPPRTPKDTSSTPQLSKTLPPAVPNPPISPLIQVLRRDWRWASISQFLWTFGQAAGLSSWDVDLFEADLDSPEDDILVPETVVKFLYTLTYDKTVSRNNLESKLRDQYLDRLPKENPFGTDRDPRRWSELGLGQKVDALYRVCEWQWSNPQKFRALLNDDEPTAWRVEPIGWDKDENTYWLFDDNRLWVQHPAPKPPKPPPKPKTNSKKAKQAARAKNKSSSSKSREKKPKPEPVVSNPIEANEPGTSTGRRSSRRAASPSLDVIQKLIAEEKGLRSTRKRTRDEVSSERTREEVDSTPSKRLRDRTGRAAPVALSTPVKVASAAAVSPASGSRSTRRTRATMGEEEVWQPIPEEWLTPSKPRTSARNGVGSGKGKGKGKETPRQKTGLESDTDDSELSELSDDDNDEEGMIRVAPVLTNKADRDTLSSELSADPDQADSGVVRVSSRQSTPLSDLEGDEAEAAEGRAGEQPTEEEAVIAVDEPMEDVETSSVPRRSLTPRVASVETSGEKEESVNGEAAQPAEEDSKPDEKMDIDESADNPVDAAVPVNGEETAGGFPINGAADEQHDGGGNAAVSAVAQDGKNVESAADGEAEEKPTELNEPDQKVLSAGQSKVDLETAPVDSMDVEPKLESEPLKEETLEEEEEEITDEVLLAAKKALNPGFLEWECVCATRWDWENWPEQFAGSKHLDEKAFYAHIVENIRPAVLVELRDKEIQRAKEEAVRNRKRSSRIAMRELEKEEAAKMEEVRRDLEARMQKVRDEEAREAAAEADKLAKEREREDRLKDREERLKQREEAIAQRAIEEIRAKEEAERAREERAQKRLNGESTAGSRSGTPNGKAMKGKGKERSVEASVGDEEQAEEAEEDEEPWELACEVCKKHGWNVDDGRNICCCESCGKWQHTDCHDKLDDSKGRKRRNWNRVTFYCHECRKRKARERHSARRNAQQQAEAEAEQTSPKIRLTVPGHASPSAGRSQGNGHSPSPMQAYASGSQIRLSPQKEAARPVSKSAPSNRLSLSPAMQMAARQQYAQTTNGYDGYSGQQQRPAQSPQTEHSTQGPRLNGSLPGQPSPYHQQSAQARQMPVMHHPGNVQMQPGAYGMPPQGMPIQSPQGAGAPQLYLQSGQPVYRHQIYPGQMHAGPAGYQPSPSSQRGLSTTPVDQHPSPSPVQQTPRQVQVSPTPRAMYAVPSAGPAHYAQGQAYYPAQQPVNHDPRYSQAANGQAYYQQAARPPSNAPNMQARPMQGGYVQPPGDVQRFMQQPHQSISDPRAQLPPPSHPR